MEEQPNSEVIKDNTTSLAAHLDARDQLVYPEETPDCHRHAPGPTFLPLVQMKGTRTVGEQDKHLLR